MKPLLEIKNLSTYFPTEHGPAKAVDGITLTLFQNKTTALVGESGSGKSVTALSIVNLISDDAYHPTGEVIFNNENLINMPYSELNKIRGNDISFIFQEPMTSLNPVFTIGNQIMETLRTHKHISKKAAKDAAIEILQEVGLPDPEKQLKAYPHQISGGMKQRVMIAMALICKPSLLIADEPTTALDVTTQAQILKLINNLKERHNTSVLFITHDIAVVAQTADFVGIMYGGKLVEYGTVRSVLKNPQHPYTLALFKALPYLHQTGDRLSTIPGTVPPAYAFKNGCRFKERCPLADSNCDAKHPELENISPENSLPHLTACYKSKEIAN